MTKFAVLAIALAVCILAFFAGRYSGYSSGFSAGVIHAIEDSFMWAIPDESSERADGADFTVEIELDGNIYEHGIYIG